jgi:hypothetical protein
LHLRILIVIHQLPDQPRERRRLNKFHAPYNTPMADSVNPPLAAIPQPRKSARSARSKVSSCSTRPSRPTSFRAHNHELRRAPPPVPSRARIYTRQFAAGGSARRGIGRA